MLNVVRADKYPLVAVHIKSKSEITSGKLVADLEVDFVGVKKSYPGIVFLVQKTNEGFHVSGKFDLKLEDHKVERPSLLGVSIEDNVPMAIEADWNKN
jgi:hypothetical protein